MIDLYLGSVGSGKSYHALKEGIEKTKQRGGFVVANFPIKARNEKEKERWIYLEDFSPKDLIRLSIERGSFGHEGRALVIVDEAGIKFNSRDWQVNPNERKEWIKFLSQSRKFGYDIILVAQDERMVDRQIRKLAEYNVKHIKLRNYKWMKLLPWQIFAAIRFWNGATFKGQVSFLFFNPFLAKRYDTMKLFDLDQEIQEIAEKNGIEI